jgi:uncharacterized membrane protein
LDAPGTPSPENSAAPPAADAPRGSSAGEESARWDSAASGEGASLFLARSGSDQRVLTLFCPAGSGDLLVNVPGFRPVGSEERMSFGSGGTVVTLVADPRGDRGRGGVSASGPLPGELPRILRGPVAVNYGAQNAGPYAAPPAGLAGNFLAGCGGRPAPPPRPQGVSACLLQDGKRLSVAPLRALGTEPFWAASIEGRCVTYSHPEDQQGTRIWTRYAVTADGGRWSGALGGRRFELTTRRQPGCSDGMSDRRYPIAVDLIVNGERRQGCAEPR